MIHFRISIFFLGRCILKTPSFGLLLFFVLVHECGIVNKNRLNIFEDEPRRGSNGHEVGYDKYPWFALLIARRRNEVLECGGALITPKHVATAAHCLENEK